MLYLPSAFQKRACLSSLISEKNSNESAHITCNHTNCVLNLLLGEEAIETSGVEGIATAPCVVASFVPTGHIGIQEGSTTGEAGVFSIKCGG